MAKAVILFFTEIYELKLVASQPGIA